MIYGTPFKIIINNFHFLTCNNRVLITIYIAKSMAIFLKRCFPLGIYILWSWNLKNKMLLFSDSTHKFQISLKRLSHSVSCKRLFRIWLSLQNRNGKNSPKQTLCGTANPLLLSWSGFRKISGCLHISKSHWLLAFIFIFSCSAWILEGNLYWLEDSWWVVNTIFSFLKAQDLYQCKEEF